MDGGGIGRHSPELPAVLARFARSRYLESYREDGGVAEGLSRLCARARQDTFEGENFARLTGCCRRVGTPPGWPTPRPCWRRRRRRPAHGMRRSRTAPWGGTGAEKWSVVDAQGLALPEVAHGSPPGDAQVGPGHRYVSAKSPRLNRPTAREPSASFLAQTSRLAGRTRPARPPPPARPGPRPALRGWSAAPASRRRCRAGRPRPSAGRAARPRATAGSPARRG